MKRTRWRMRQYQLEEEKEQMNMMAEKYDWPRIAAKTLEVYRRVLGS